MAVSKDEEIAALKARILTLEGDLVAADARYQRAEADKEKLRQQRGLTVPGADGTIEPNVINGIKGHKDGNGTDDRDGDARTSPTAKDSGPPGAVR